MTPRGMTTVGFFWSRVNTSPGIQEDELSECWEWTGAKDYYGYGVIRDDQKRLKAHRFSHELHAGRAIPDGVLIDHRCHHRECVNPAHLREVDRSLNGANRRGANPASKSGVRGVYQRKNGRYQARFRCRDGHIFNVGIFDDLDEAREAIGKARREEWGEYAGRD